MSRRRTTAWLICFAALAGYGGHDLINSPGNGASNVDSARVLPARVERVVDGDTVKVAIGGERETVRYIGVDTPETRKPGSPVECFGHAASDYNRRLVDRRRVTLRFDRERRDRYGRLLAYVFLGDGRFVNALLVRGGFATTLRIAPNTTRASHLKRLELTARVARRGLWRACGGARSARPR